MVEPRAIWSSVPRVLPNILPLEVWWNLRERPLGNKIKKKEGERSLDS